MNSSEQAYDRDNFLANFIGCKCFDVECSKEEYDDSISEINAMIQHNIDIGNSEEIKEWRKMLQRAKVEKRRAGMIESKKETRIALT
jgi:hypothetical protein